MNIVIEDSWERGTGAPREYRYSAVDDDTYDGPGSPIGSGATPEEARADLLEQLADLDEAQHAPDPDVEWMDQMAFERAHDWGRS